MDKTWQAAMRAVHSVGVKSSDDANTITAHLQHWVESGGKAETFLKYREVPPELIAAYKAAADVYRDAATPPVPVTEPINRQANPDPADRTIDFADDSEGDSRSAEICADVIILKHMNRRRFCLTKPEFRKLAAAIDDEEPESVWQWLRSLVR